MFLLFSLLPSDIFCFSFLFHPPLLSSVRLMTSGTVWVKCCRLRVMLQLPPSVSLLPWSWRPAAPYCPSPSSPEHYETHWQLYPQWHSSINDGPASGTHSNHRQHACMPLHKILLPFPRNNYCKQLQILQINIDVYTDTFPYLLTLPTMPCCLGMSSDSRFHFGSSTKSVKSLDLFRIWIRKQPWKCIQIQWKAITAHPCCWVCDFQLPMIESMSLCPDTVLVHLHF